MADLYIPDDIFLYIIEYLNVSDCIAFALSGVSNCFPDFLARTRNFDFRRCYGLKENLCLQYLGLTTQVHKIVYLNLENCYWFSDVSLSNSIHRLVNLAELNVVGTALSLSSIMSNVLLKCHKLSRLSVSISEGTWELFRAAIGDLRDCHKENLKNICYLNLHVLDSSSPTIWILLFHFLRWCISCQELHLSLFTTNMIRQSDPWEYQDNCNQVIKLCRKDLYRSLNWMAQLKSFSVQSKLNDQCLNDWCQWFLNEIHPTCLETIWLPNVKILSFHNSFYQKAGQLKALCLNGLHYSSLAAPAFEQMTHLGTLHLPVSTSISHLKFIKASCSSYADLSDFCQHHEKLEHMQIQSHACSEATIYFEERWPLERLRYLAYSGSNPNPDVLEQFIRSSPNLEELHIKRTTAVNIFLSQELRDNAYWSISRLKLLKKLTITGVEFTRGTFLSQVLKRCNQLEVLHIGGLFEEEISFHSDLCQYLPFAEELRDFRYQREEMRDSMLLDLLSAIEFCKKLERLVIHQEAAWGSPTNKRNKPATSLDEKISELVANRLTSLQLFCLVYPAGSHIVEKLTSEFKTKIVPIRPSFWFYVGDDLPKGKDVPRIHLDEIIDPVDCFLPIPELT